MSWSNDRTNFDRNIAVIIGIDDYQNGIHPLSTPVNDATVLADLLKTEYEYQEMVCLFPPYKEATLENINELLTETLPNQIRPTEGDRLLFYFAGHGIARNSEDGPAGYLIPQDAQLGKLETFLPMRDLNAALSQLDCHHLLVILDCCFAGNFRWSSARNVIPVPETIHREHYDRFIRSSAWQAITSAAHNQEALDFLSDLRDTAKNSHHSPFALALIEGLKDNKADLTGDGVITAPELYLYLRDRLIGKDGVSELQTPGLWPLQKHDRGEFIFTLPGFEREQLTPAPPLDENNNPYRGLQPFDENHARFFFGRQELVEELYKRISQSKQSSSQLIVVMGISGSGKSSLVKAGLIPHLRKNYAQEWHILEPMRPGKSPFIALAKTIFPIANNFSDADKYKQLIRDLNKGESNRLIDILTEWVVGIVRAWSQANPQVKLLLTIDQFEELITMSRKATPISSDIESDSNEQKPQRWLSSVFRRQSKAKNNERPEQKDDVQQEWQQFLALLANTLKNCPQLHIVLTLRSDFEARFVESAFKDYWDKSRFPMRTMRADELREAIEKPASEMALYFEPANSVDRLIDEVGEMPGALPLLSFTLSELYIKLHQAWVKDGKEDRALTVDEEFYQQGGIAGSLTYRANEIYDGLPDDVHRATMRRVILRMVEIEGGESVRRRVSKAELNYPDSDENTRVEYVINCLDEARLVVKGQEAREAYVEPAHDFLVKGWNKLQDWIKEEQENLALQRRLTPAALEWNSKEQSSIFLEKVEPVWNWFDQKLDLLEDWFNKIKKDGQEGSREKKAQFLWNGNPYLDVLKKTLKSRNYWFNQVETEFVERSVRQKLRNIRLRRFAYISILVGVTTAAIVIEQRRIEAERQTTIASARASEAFFVSNQQLEALIAGVKAAKILQKEKAIHKQTDVLNQTVISLEQAVYGVRERNRLTEHSGPVQSVSFSQDGQMIASASWDGTVKLWSQNGQLFKTLDIIADQPLTTHSSIIWSVSLSRDGQLIAAGSDDGKVTLWSRDGQRLNTLSRDSCQISTPEKDCSARSISISADGQLIAAGYYDGTIILWSRDGQLLKAWPGHSEIVTRVRFSPDDQMIASSSFDTVKLWNREGTWIKTFRHHDTVEDVDFSSDSQMIAYTDNKIVNVWNLDDQWLKTFRGHTNQVTSISFNPNGKIIASSSSDNTIKLWSIRDEKELATLKGHSAEVTSVSFSPNGKMLASGSEDTTVRLWSLDVQQPPILESSRDKITKISFSTNGQLIAGIEDSGIKIWSRNGRLLKTLNAGADKANSISFSPANQTIAFGNFDRTVKLWNFNTQELKVLTGHTEAVRSVSFSSDGQIVASGSDDKTVKLWSRDGKLLNTLNKHTGGIWSVSFSPDGKMIASGSDGSESKVNLWSRDGHFLKTLSGHSGTINSISFSPDGQRIATASSDNTVKLWSRDGDFLRTLRGHDYQVFGVSFSPEGKMIASADWDGTVKLWSREGQLLKTFAKRSNCSSCVWSVSFSPDGQTLAAGSNDGILLWNLALDDLVMRGCAWLRDYLEKNSNVVEGDRHLCDAIGNSQE